MYRMAADKALDIAKKFDLELNLGIVKFWEPMLKKNFKMSEEEIEKAAATITELLIDDESFERQIKSLFVKAVTGVDADDSESEEDDEEEDETIQKCKEAARTVAKKCEVKLGSRFLWRLEMSHDKNKPKIFSGDLEKFIKNLISAFKRIKGHKEELLKQFKYSGATSLLSDLKVDTGNKNSRV